MNLALIPWLSLAVTAAGSTEPSSAIPAEAPQERRPPNFVIILADDLGYGDLGCYGSKTIATPRIDALAARGARFTDFYAAAPFCSPSRASLLTGRYPAHCGVPYVLFPAEHTGLPPGEITLAELLQEQGYATACIGKWHLGWDRAFRPISQGFDEFFGLPYSNDSNEWPVGEPFRQIHGLEPLPLIDGDRVVEAPADQARLTGRYTERAVQFIRRNKDRPFFLYLPHTMPHIPQYASEAFAGRSRGGLYGDAVEELDWSTGQILDALESLGLDERTLVLFTSDNGAVVRPSAPARPANDRFPGRSNGGSVGPLRGGKGNTYEGGMRMPAIASWPGQIPAGLVIGEPSSTLDLFPTLARLAGTDLPRDRSYPGSELAEMLRGAPARAGGEPRLFGYYFGPQLQAVRQGPWKLFLPITAPPEPVPVSLWYEHAPELFKRHHRPWPAPVLYDLGRDIGEAHDVAAEHPEVVRRLTALARDLDAAQRRDARAMVFLDGPKPPTPRQVRRADENLTAWQESHRATTKGDPRRRRVPAVVPAGVTAHRDLVYARYGNEAMPLDLFQPDAARADGRLPAVLVVTGGGWTQGDRKRLGHIATWLSGHGFVTAALDYQLAGEGRPSFPRALQDCKAAVRFLRANAGRYGIDPDRIGVVGGSAGGHLAALLGTSAGVAEFEGDGGNPGASSAVQAVAVMAGPVDLTAPQTVRQSRTNPRAPVNLLLGKTYAEAPALYQAASPLHHLDAGDSPFLFLDGSEDHPEQRYTAFRARLRELGVDERMVVLPEGPHGMWNMEGWFPATAEQLRRFLARTLKSTEK